MKKFKPGDKVRIVSQSKFYEYWRKKLLNRISIFSTDLSEAQKEAELEIVLKINARKDFFDKIGTISRIQTQYNGKIYYKLVEDPDEKRVWEKDLLIPVTKVFFNNESVI